MCAIVCYRGHPIRKQIRHCKRRLLNGWLKIFAPTSIISKWLCVWAVIRKFLTETRAGLSILLRILFIIPQKVFFIIIRLKYLYYDLFDHFIIKLLVLSVFRANFVSNLRYKFSQHNLKESVQLQLSRIKRLAFKNEDSFVFDGNFVCVLRLLCRRYCFITISKKFIEFSVLNNFTYNVVMYNIDIIPHFWEISKL